MCGSLRFQTKLRLPNTHTRRLASDFNTANDLASQLVWGRYYQSKEPCFKPTKLMVARSRRKSACFAEGCQRGRSLTRG